MTWIVVMLGAANAGAQNRAYFSYQKPVGSGFTAPTAVAVDQSGDVFVTDPGSAPQIQEIVAAGGAVTSGSTVNKSVLTNGNDNSLRAVAVDKAGNLYLADNGGDNLFEIPAGTGNISNPLPTPTGGYQTIYGVAVDGSGNLYVTDLGTSMVKPEVYEIIAVNGSVGPASQVVTLPAPAGGYGAPFGVAVDGNGNVYVADTISGGLVYQIQASNGSVSGSSAIISLPAPSGTTQPIGVAADGYGNVFVSDYALASVYEVAAASGTVSASSAVMPIASGFSNNLAGIAVDGHGNLFVADIGAQSVYEISIQAANLGLVNVGSSSAATLTFNFPSATSGTVVIGRNVLTNGAAGQDFSDAGTGSCATSMQVYGVGQFGGASCTIDVIFSPKAVGLRTGVVQLLAPSGDVVGSALLSGVGQGGMITVDPGVVAKYTGGLKEPVGVAVDAAGDLFVTDWGTSLGAGLFEIAAGSTTALPIGSGFQAPIGLALDASGNLYITDLSSNVFQIQNTNTTGGFTPGAQTTVISSTTTIGGTALNQPKGIAVGPDGVLYIADSVNDRIVTLNPAIGATGVYATGLNTPEWLAVDAAGTVYVSNYSDLNVLVYSAGVLTNNLSNIPGISAPVGIVVDPSGSLLVADSNSSNIVRIPNESGTLTVADAVTVEQAGTGHGYSIALDASGNLYAADASTAPAGAVYAIQRNQVNYSFGSVTEGSSSPLLTINAENAGNLPVTLATPAVATIVTPFTVAQSNRDACADGQVVSSGELCQYTAAFFPAFGASTTPMSLNATIGGTWLATTATPVSAAIVLAGTAVVPPANQVAINTNPQGETFTIDGGSTVYTAPQTFAWTPGSTHTVTAVAATAPVNQTEWMFGSWSAGTVTGNTTSYFVPGDTTDSLTATYFPASQVTYSVSDPAHASISATWLSSAPGSQTMNLNSGDYVFLNSSVTFTATVNPAYVVSGWTENGTSVGAPSSFTYTNDNLSGVDNVVATITPLPSYVVNTNADDATGTSANCPLNPTTSGAGNCTLRDALAASAVGGGAITFDSTVFATQQTITLVNGTLVVPAMTSIVGLTSGSGATLTNLVQVDGNQNFTVFTTGLDSSMPIGLPDAQSATAKTKLASRLPNNIGVSPLMNPSPLNPVVLANLTIQNGNGGADGDGLPNGPSGSSGSTGASGSSGPSSFGGAGGINNYGSLTVNNCLFTGNTGTDAGAIYNWDGQLTVTGSTFTNNQSYGGYNDGDGDWYGDAGAIFNDDYNPNMFEGDAFAANSVARLHASARVRSGAHTRGAHSSAKAAVSPLFSSNSGAGSLSVTNSTFTGNSGTYTGGIYNYSTLLVAGSTFGGVAPGAGNTSQGDGNGDPDAGALVSDTEPYQAEAGATATVIESTFTNNTGAMGGAITNADEDADGASLFVKHSTFAGNTSQGDDNGDADAGAIESMWNGNTETGYSTFFGNTSNSSSGAGAMANYDGAALIVFAATVTGNAGFNGAVYNVADGENSGLGAVVNSIVSLNTTTDSTFIADNIAPDQNGMSISPGNVIGSATINLAPLGNYGGPTQTMLPLAPSSAICAGSGDMLVDARTGSGFPMTSDQRGYSNINTSYPGYSTSTPCLDAGAVQTNYALAFTGAYALTANSAPSIGVGVAFTSSNAPVVTLSESNATATLANGSVAGSASPEAAAGTTSATLAAGVGAFPGLSFPTAQTGEVLTGTLSLNPALEQPLSLTATSASFDVLGAAVNLALAPGAGALPAGTLGASYSQTFLASGGTAPYTYTVSGLPAGLSLNPSTGILSGTPLTAVTNATFTVTATDSNAVTISQLYSLSIGKATPFVAVSVNSATTFLLNPITLTATVSFTPNAPNADVAPNGSGISSGTVTFLDGTTPLGTGTVVNGLATLTTAALTAGSHTITAGYGGDADFLIASSTSVNEFVEDFTVTGVSTAGTAKPGSSVQFDFTVNPPSGATFPAAINLSLSGLPSGATYSFSPASLSAGAGSTPVTLTVNLPQTSAKAQPSDNLARRLAPLSLALLLLPFAGRFRRASKSFSRTMSLLLLLGFGLVASLGLSGCNSTTGFFGQNQQTYTVTVTGTSGLLSHSATVTLTVE